MFYKSLLIVLAILGMALAQQCPFEHRIREGDTLMIIANYYNIPHEELLRYNPRIQDPNLLLTANERITIPCPSFEMFNRTEYNYTMPEILECPFIHTTAEGETLESIAQLYDLPLSLLTEENRILTPTLNAGFNLTIPCPPEEYRMEEDDDDRREYREEDRSEERREDETREDRRRENDERED
jgi:LysM repeat protein